MTAAIALLALGAITAALSLQLPLGTLRLPGSGLFPLALGLLLALLATVQLARLLLARRAAAAAAPAQPATPPQPVAPDGATRRVALFMATVAVATALLQVVGYVVSSLLLMLGLLWVLGVRWRVAVPVAVVSAACSHVLFVLWLKIPMPPGPFGF
jgi:putative tricarboxylic transport membrane protein